MQEAEMIEEAKILMLHERIFQERIAALKAMEKPPAAAADAADEGKH